MLCSWSRASLSLKAGDLRSSMVTLMSDIVINHVCIQVTLWHVHPDCDL